VAGDLDGGGWAAGAATSDLELRAREVELRWRAGVVDTELLDAEQVLSCRDLAGDSDRVSCAQIPLGLSRGEVRANLLDLDYYRSVNIS
jgi:hypothetical protein